jgi:putative PIG3 family NAD(P)H quinone oxidoreductase
VLIRVAAAGVNRADIGQRQGTYPPPPGALSELPGMEVSGTIERLGDGVTGWSVGDRVCALLPSGGYASLAVASATQLFPVPDSMDLIDAAGLPEAICTVWSNVYLTAGLVAGETLLVHGGSSGIGTIAIQLARAMGSLVATTAGSAAKLDACRALGADILVNYKTDDFVSAVLDATEQRGAEVILDAIGGGYLDRNMHALAPHGRLVLIGNQSGEQGSLNVGALMGKWASIHGSTLRARPAAEKNAIVASVLENVWPLVEAGLVVPVIDRRFPLAEAADAHRRMESSEHIGKILLVP